ncbi:MAG: ArsA family ATPase, partial [Euryarchaeota archaeon]
EAKISALLPKVGSAMEKMNSSGALGSLGMMLDPKAKDEIKDIKGEIKTSDMVIPGLDEAMAFDELLQHVEDPNWDVIVFDTAPTGHTLRFLSLPELIEAWSDRVIRMMRVSGGIRSMMFGRKESDAMKEELEKFQRRVLHVRRVLSNDEITSFTLVTIPERMGVNETIRAQKSLQEFNLPIGGCLVNRLTPEFDHPFLKTRRDAELEIIEELKESLGLDVSCMELFETEVVGIERLREVGQYLYGPVTEIDSGLGPHSIGSILHHEVHRGMVKQLSEDTETIFLHYPGIKREELSLRSEEGVLFVGLNDREKEVKTSIPVKASQVNAKLEGDVLRLDIPLKDQ